DDQVVLSTLTISITTPDNGPRGDGPDNFLDGLVAGWNSLVDWLQDAIVFVGKAIPWLGFLVVLGALGWFVRGLIRRPRAAAHRPAARAENRASPGSSEADAPAGEKPTTTGGSGAADRGAGDDQTEQP